MEICNNLSCNNIAEVDKIIEAPFSMTSTATQSRKKIKICRSCAAHEEMLKIVLKAPGQLNAGP